MNFFRRERIDKRHPFYEEVTTLIEANDELLALLLESDQFIDVADSLDAPASWRDFSVDRHAYPSHERLLEELRTITLIHFGPIAVYKYLDQFLTLLPTPVAKLVKKGYKPDTAMQLYDWPLLKKKVNEKLTPHVDRFVSMSAFLHVENKIPYHRMMQVSRLYAALFTLDDLLAQEVNFESDEQLNSIVLRLLAFAKTLAQSGEIEEAMLKVGDRPVEMEFLTVLAEIWAEVKEDTNHDPEALIWWKNFCRTFADHMGAALKHEFTIEDAYYSEKEKQLQSTFQEMLNNPVLGENAKVEVYVRLRLLISGMFVATQLNHYVQSNYFTFDTLSQNSEIPKRAVELLEELEILTATFGALLNDLISFWKELYKEFSIMNWPAVATLVRLKDEKRKVTIPSQVLLNTLLDQLETLNQVVSRSNEIYHQVLPEYLDKSINQDIAIKMMIQAEALRPQVKNSYVWQVSQGMARYRHPQALFKEIRPENFEQAGGWFDDH